MTQTVDTLIHARWIIPVEPDNTVLEHHSLAVKNGKIAALLPTAEAHQQFQASNTVALGDHVVIPGLINSHTHAPMNLMRGVADDKALMDWLQNHIWPIEATHVSSGFVYEGTQMAIAESLRGGVTCFNEMYFFPDEAARACNDVGFRATVGLIVIDFPTVWAASADEYLDKALAVHDQCKEYDLITTAFAPHAPYTVSDEPMSRIRVLADQMEIPIHMHVHETNDELQQGLAKNNKHPLEHLNHLGILSPQLMAVHMTQLNDDEIKLCAETGINVIHCPESNMKLASGFCPVANLLDAGVNVALGTDGAASNNDLDMFGEMRTAALLAKSVANNAAAVPAHTALRMATLNGAKAMGIDQITGSLEIGKAADITAIDLSALETQPVYDPVSVLVYAASRHQVSDVWIDGKRQLENGKLTQIDTQALQSKLAQWADKIRQTEQA